MSSLADWFSNVIATIKNVPISIIDSIKSNYESLTSNLGTWFDNVGTSLSDMRTSFVDGLSDSVQSMLDNLGTWFDNIDISISKLGTFIINGFLDILKTIFIPDPEFIDEKVEYLKYQFYKLGVATFDMSSIMGKETPFSDITCSILGHEVVIVRMDIVDKCVMKFRAVIRGFITLLLIAYNYDMFMGLIGQQGMQIGTHIRNLKKDDE